MRTEHGRQASAGQRCFGGHGEGASYLQDIFELNETRKGKNLEFALKDHPALNGECTEEAGAGAGRAVGTLRRSSRSGEGVLKSPMIRPVLCG